MNKAKLKSYAPQDFVIAVIAVTAVTARANLLGGSPVRAQGDIRATS